MNVYSVTNSSILIFTWLASDECERKRSYWHDLFVQDSAGRLVKAIQAMAALFPNRKN